MKSLHMPARLIVLILVDAAIIYLAIMIVFSQFGQSESVIGLNGFEISLQRSYILFGIIFLMFVFGLYDYGVLVDARGSFYRLCVTMLIAIFFFAVSYYFIQVLRVRIVMVLSICVLSIAFIWVSRATLFGLAGVQSLKRSILVLGAGDTAKAILDLERDGNIRDFHCVGFVPIGDGAIKIDERHLERSNGRLRDLLERLRAAEIVIALDDRRNTLPMPELLDCRLHGATITNFSSFIEKETKQVEIQGLYPSWLIFSPGFEGLSLAQQAIKRIFDVVVSLVLMALSLPVCLVTMLAIYLEDGMPVFYRQERVGYHGRIFSLLKFRSMRRDAEKDGVAQWAKVNDPRVTRVGAFIRQVRIDEIPQIWNVLLGDMSFVGPRPERPSIVAELIEHIPYFKYREVVKPGITGWGQVNYPYGASLEDARQKLKYDLFYIKNYSLILDIIVVLQTVKVVLWPKGVR